jgi:hypothetical protein
VVDVLAPDAAVQLVEDVVVAGDRVGDPGDATAGAR